MKGSSYMIVALQQFTKDLFYYVESVKEGKSALNISCCLVKDNFCTSPHYGL